MRQGRHAEDRCKQEAQHSQCVAPGSHSKRAYLFSCANRRPEYERKPNNNMLKMTCTSFPLRGTRVSTGTVLPSVTLPVFLISKQNTPTFEREFKTYNTFKRKSGECCAPWEGLDSERARSRHSTRVPPARRSQTLATPICIVN